MLFALGVVVVASYAVDRIFWRPPGEVYGPMSLWNGLRPFSYALSGALIIATSLREQARRPMSTLFVGVALLLEPMAQGTNGAIFMFAPDFPYGNPYAIIEYVFRLLAIAIGLAACAVLLGRGRSHSSGIRPRVAVALILVPAVLAVALQTGFQFGYSNPFLRELWMLVVGLALVAIPASIAFAVVRDGFPNDPKSVPRPETAYARPEFPDKHG